MGATLGSPLKMLSQFTRETFKTILVSFVYILVTTVGEYFLKYML